MGKLQLTFACGNYDRTQALRDGRVQPDGIDLNYLALTPPQLFPRMLEHREFEASELSLSGFLKSRCQDNPPVHCDSRLPVQGLSPLDSLCEHGFRH